MIANSRIRDKEAHTEALRKYQRICTREQIEQELEEKFPDEAILIEKYEELSPMAGENQTT